MTNRQVPKCVASIVLVIYILITFFLGLVMPAAVTLDSIKIYNTHELPNVTPTVYFICQGGNKTELPDVKQINVSYAFNGHESWQPLTEFASIKCKRCGFYEADVFSPDDVFDEWEICPSDFRNSDGKYRRNKDKEFTAEFLCSECSTLSIDSNSSPQGVGSKQIKRHKKMHLALLICVIAAVSILLGAVALVAHRQWEKKKRAQDQARFMRLFEDGDDLEDELGLAL